MEFQVCFSDGNLHVTPLKRRFQAADGNLRMTGQWSHPDFKLNVSTSEEILNINVNPSYTGKQLTPGCRPWLLSVTCFSSLFLSRIPPEKSLLSQIPPNIHWTPEIPRFTSGETNVCFAFTVLILKITWTIWNGITTA